MTLRSSISGLATRAPTPAPVVAAAVENDRESIVDDGSDSKGGITQDETPVRRGRVAAPATRVSIEETQAQAEKPARAPRQPRAKAVTDKTGASPAELRAQLKEVEAEAKALNEQRQAALAKFQPKIDALKAKHADINAQLAAALFN